MKRSAQIKIPEKLIPVFDGPARYRGAHGGRGSGKSRSFALMAAVRGYQKPLRILCARELQNSIKESSLAEVAAAIRSIPWLDAHYEIGQSFIRGKNGTEFLFKGLRHNVDDIKSTARIGICWVEEAERVAESSWQVLIPTVREDESEIWGTWNPEALDSPVRQRFIVDPAPGTKVAELNYLDNPCFPEVLEAERLHMQRSNPEMYAHVWLGECITRTDAQILAGKWEVAEFQAAHGWDGPYHGADWGFANDPTTLVKCWIYDRQLYVEYESWHIGLDLDETAEQWQQDVPGCAEYVVRADCARPESISYVSRHGMPRLMAADKWAGSVADGIAHLRSYDRIIIHPRCERMIEEARLYSWKVDRLTGDILPVPIDKWNHCLDATRYSLDKIIQQGNGRVSAPLPKPASVPSFRQQWTGTARQPGTIRRVS